MLKSIPTYQTNTQVPIKYHQLWDWSSLSFTLKLKPRIDNKVHSFVQNYYVQWYGWNYLLIQGKPYQLIPKAWIWNNYQTLVSRLSLDQIWQKQSDTIQQTWLRFTDPTMFTSSQFQVGTCSSWLIKKNITSSTWN